MAFAVWEETVAKGTRPRFVLAVAASASAPILLAAVAPAAAAPVPPLPTDNGVPLQLPLLIADNIARAPSPRFVRAVDALARSLRLLASSSAPILLAAVAPAVVAPVPPLETASCVPLQLKLLMLESVAREPSPRLVRAVAAFARSLKLLPISSAEPVFSTRRHVALLICVDDETVCETEIV